MTELSPADAGRTLPISPVSKPETPPNSPGYLNSPEYLTGSQPPPSGAQTPRRSRSPRQRSVQSPGEDAHLEKAVAYNVLERMDTSMTQKYQNLADMPLAIRTQFQRLLQDPTFDPSTAEKDFRLHYTVTFKIETVGWNQAWISESDRV